MYVREDFNFTIWYEYIVKVITLVANQLTFIGTVLIF